MTENKYLRWLAGETPTLYWHDSAVISELDEAIGNGAVGVTTNPFLVNATLRAQPDFWRAQGITTQNLPEGDARAEHLIGQVAGFVARKVAPFRSAGYGHGYCCAQLNPNRPCHTAVMNEMADRYASFADNIVIKIPATKAGLAVLEDCVARGYNVAATVSFTVPQVLAVGAAFQRGAVRCQAAGREPGLGIAVVMVGRLDDYLRDVMHESDGPATEEDIIWAGTAAIKRAYGIFQERGYESILMPAGCRGAYHITEIAGARMICSVAPKIAGLLYEVKEPFAEKIDRPVDPAIISRLMTLPEFVKAYEPNGMSPDEFITFGSTNRTLTQFCDNGWNPLQTLSI
jgi:transaldolase